MNQTPFLESLALELLNKYNNDLSDLTIVLPSHRSTLYLKKYLAKHKQTTFWSPNILTADDLMEQLSGMHAADNMYLILELFQIFKKHHPEENKNFEEFIGLGNMIIKDFNEVDVCLLSAKEVFTVLSEVKAIATWNLDHKPLTENQKKYLHLYNSLYPIYEEFSEKLLARKTAYKGLIYRTAAEKDLALLKKQFRGKVIFAGLNAMTTAEKKIVEKLLQLNLCLFYWDADAYYLDNEKHEAGIFIREHKKIWCKTNFQWKFDLLKTTSKHIETIAVASNVLQTKVAGEILRNLSNEDFKYNKTALILCDESLLIPALNSLPHCINAVNVTMGYSFKYAPLFHFINGVIKIFCTIAEQNLMNENKLMFYSKELINALSNLLFCLPIKAVESKNEINKIIQKIISDNRIFCQANTIANFCDESQDVYTILQPLLTIQKIDSVSIIDAIDQLVQQLALYFHRTADTSLAFDKIQIEQLLVAKKICQQLKQVISQYPEDVSPAAINILFNQLAQETEIAFFGEPLQGLQVMGMLETRGLDFENIILLSVNENIIPKAKMSNTLVPFDIKKAYNMNTFVERDAIYAYHFYRLLQRASNIYLVYNTDIDNINKGEKSRYILQIEQELAQLNKNITFKNKSVEQPTPKITEFETIKIFKDQKIIQQLKNKLLEGIAPSAINTYRNCSLHFYFSQIARIKEQQAVEEQIQSNTFGNIIHEIMKKILLPYKDNSMQIFPQEIKQANISNEIDNAFRKHFRNQQFDTGNNMLLRAVAEKIVKEIIDNEIQYAQETINQKKNYSIVLLEEELNHVVNFNNTQVKIKGIIDRIHKIDNVLYVVDYKSKRIDFSKTDFDFNNIDIHSPEFADHLFQVFCYSWLVFKNAPQPNRAIIPGFVSFKNVKKGFIYLFEKPWEEASIQQFEVKLIDIIKSMLDTEKPFEQATDTKVCKYCPYTKICAIKAEELQNNY